MSEMPDPTIEYLMATQSTSHALKAYLDSAVLRDPFDVMSELETVTVAWEQRLRETILLTSEERG
jgi:hypothetical protein